MRAGLTGGVAPGESTVVRKLEQSGALTIDTDVLARDVMALGTEGLKVVIARFGDSVLITDRSLDRSVLARVVFADPQVHADLNAIIHPFVRRRAAELEVAVPVGAVAVYVASLLVEAGQQDRFDVVVVVDTTVKGQLRRLTHRDGLTQTEAEQRVAAQAGREKRLGAAMHVIGSSGLVRETMRQVDELWQSPSM